MLSEPQPKQLRFSNEALRRLLIPLMVEQLLIVSVGLVDSMMVASVGEAAVSGVSLVDQINLLIIQVFAALATGGAVVVSQYIGRGKKDTACVSAKQLIYLVVMLSGIIAFLVVVFNKHILTLVFGATEPSVMQAAETYFWISALSYPFIALYNAGAALFRSMGNSRISLFASLIMNVINICGNAILIYGFNMGVAGAAIASLVSRIVASFIVIYLLHNQHNVIYIKNLFKFEWVSSIQSSILRIGVPSGIENGMFQIGKILVASLIASMGLVAMASNAVCNNVASIVNVPGTGVGLALITIVGQCVGAKDEVQAKYYTKKLMIIAYIGTGAITALLWVFTPWLTSLYQLSDAATELSIFVLRYHCIMMILFWPASFTLPNALRAAGDARYTMVVSMISMWLCRVALSYVLGAWLGWGFFGVWVAMTLDWVVRGLFFVPRSLGKAWLKKRVIDN